MHAKKITVPSLVPCGTPPLKGLQPRKRVLIFHSLLTFRQTTNYPFNNRRGNIQFNKSIDGNPVTNGVKSLTKISEDSCPKII